jgi:uncharacterized phage-associated protein
MVRRMREGDKAYKISFVLIESDLYIILDKKPTADMIKERVRTEKEVVSNRVLLLYLISKSKRSDLAITKLQKLTYLAEHCLAKEKTKAFSYHFKKWDYGPFSRELYDDYDGFVERRIVAPTNIRLTKRGERLLEGLSALFEENEQVLHELDDKVVDRFSKKTRKEVVDYVYDIKVTLGRVLARIEDVPEGTDLTERLPEKEIKDRFNLDEGWIDTYCILADDDACRSFREGIEDVRAGRVTITRC